MAKKRDRHKKKGTGAAGSYPSVTLAISRIGRLLIKSRLEAPRHQSSHERVAHYEQCQERLRQNIKELRRLLDGIDPIELCTSVLLENLVDPTRYEESTSSAWEHVAEYVFSICSALPNTSYGAIELNDVARWRILNAVDRVFCDSIELMFTKPMGDKDDLDEFCAQMYFHNLMVRGHSYPQHTVDLANRIGSPHDRWMRVKYGFSTQELLETFNVIQEQIQARIDEWFDWCRAVVVRHSAGENGESHANKSTCAAEGIVTPEEVMDGLLKRYDRLCKTGRDLVRVDRSDSRISAAVLKACSCEPGDNAPFLDEPFAGYPSKESVIWDKPLFRVGQEYYCPVPSLLTRAVDEVLEALLNEGSYATTFCRVRGNVLEELAIEYIQTLLPEATVYRNIRYPLADGNKAEADAVVLFDRHVFVIEAKAGSLSAEARRGAPARLKREFRKLISDAFVQGLRVRDHIMKHKEASFEDKRGRPVVTLSRENIDRVFIINPTLAAMGPLSVQLKYAREHGLLGDADLWPWCVFINDLRVIAELLDSPAEFVLFLERRLKVNRRPLIVPDELDLFGEFLEHGLYYKEGDFNLHFGQSPDRLILWACIDP